MRHTAFLCLCLLTACGEWPDAGGPPMSRRSQDWPKLLPLEQLLATGEVEEADPEDAEALRRRAEGLQARANILRGSATDMEALRSRLDR